MVVTKLDETEDIGNVLSVSKSNDLPLLFFTNGQKVPENLLKATNEAILSYLRGFALDLQALSQNQNTSNHTQ
jgi:flagellar biosynthesis protein FlhF